jgi:uncharacterized protein YlxW (UPF0749 family)
VSDPSYVAHLAELLGLMRTEMRKGFEELKAELSDRVSVDVYEAEKRLTEERHDRLGREVADLRADADREREQRRAADQAAAERRAADRRMVIGAVLAAVLSLLVALAAAALAA